MAVGTLLPGCVLAALLGRPQPIETADAQLAHFRGLLADLQQVTAHEIDNVPGIDQHNAACILAIVELGLRRTLSTDEERATIHSPAESAALVQPALKRNMAGRNS